MRNSICQASLILLAAGLFCSARAGAADARTNPEKKGEEMVAVRIETSMGNIVAELDGEKAPLTVRNFLSYAREGFYDGTIFHRVIEGFMIQGGGYEPGMSLKKTGSPIPNEAENGLKNRKGTLAMARTPAINSATSQFFINLVDNPFLDHKNKTPGGFGYAVFGQVVEGMEVVEAIGSVPTGRAGGFDNVPDEAVVIEKVVLVEEGGNGEGGREKE